MLDSNSTAKINNKSNLNNPQDSISKVTFNSIEEALTSINNNFRQVFFSISQKNIYYLITRNNQMYEFSIIDEPKSNQKKFIVNNILELNSENIRNLSKNAFAFNEKAVLNINSNFYNNNIITSIINI